MSVAFSKVSGATGYEIKYSLKTNKKKFKTISVTTNKGTIKKLQKGKKYVVYVRAYVLDTNGKKAYGKWSKKKTVTVIK